MTDTTRPNLSSFTFTSVIDLSSGDKPLTFTASATDDLSGVSQVFINFAKPIVTTSSGTTYAFSIFDGNDSFSDGQSTSNYTLSKFNASGSYAIDSVVV
jgi:hypothetical protein